MHGPQPSPRGGREAEEGGRTEAEKSQYPLSVIYIMELRASRDWTLNTDK